MLMLFKRSFVPPLTEPGGGLQPAAASPQPGSRGADAASESVNPCGPHKATGGGSAARSPPTCQEVFETLTIAQTQFEFKSTPAVFQCISGAINMNVFTVTGYRSP